MFYWLFGYDKTDGDSKDDDDEEIPPPPKLERQEGCYKECSKDDIIKWKDYDKELKEIREEIRKIKTDSDEKWNRRLSPVLQTQSVRKKRKKKSESAFDKNKI